MPVIFLILACALWGLSFPLIKVLHLEQAARLPGESTYFLSSWLQFARFGMGALMLAPFVIGRVKLLPEEIRQGLILAFWGGAGMWLQVDGLARTEASTSAFLTQAYCIFLPLWACIRAHRLPQANVTIATLLVLAGGALLSGITPSNLNLGTGEIETLAAALIFSLQIVTLENPRYRTNRGLPVSFVMFAGIAVLFAIVSLLTVSNSENLVRAGASIPAMTLVFSLALFCSVGAYGLMNTWQPRVSATEAGMIYTTEPIFTAVYVLFLPEMIGKFVGQRYVNESLTWQLALGGTLILVANALMQWKRPPHLPSAGPVSEMH